MASRNDKAGTGRWAYAYNPPKSNSKTAQPEIPEPQFRVGPPGVSSGLSFRNLPDASLLAIRQICTHYEKKCSGKYSAKSLASRYIFQMSREILSQLQAMSHNAGGAGQRVRDLESILQEWNDNFGRDQEEGFQGMFGIVPMTPTALKNTLVNQRKKILELEKLIGSMEKKSADEKAQLAEVMETQVEASRLQAEADRGRQQDILVAMRKRCDDDVALAQAQAKAAKEEAKKALDFDRKRAEKTISNALDDEREKSIKMKKNLDFIEEKLNKEWASKLRHLEVKVKTAEDSKRAAVEKACDKLKRVHAAELAAAVREAAMHAGRAAMDQASSGTGMRRGSTAAADKARVTERNLKRDEEHQEEKLIGETAEEIKKGPEDATIALTGKENTISSGDGGASASKLKLLKLKLKNQQDESAWLRNRVSDLETMLKTMKVAMEGSLQAGAGEKQFEGWRQVVSVQYPWLRDRKREDPKRYSYMQKGVQKGKLGVGS
ncbi:hypothetical protein TrCOL_g11479 [Triparma columacea]|uniref:Uncharacterized protein n=1 Tax=Triparma columacea TaxID=722753 RepID=A0A9W7G7N7_9STRA|nr:hypothetical protein TrCOL_g11479 [Triparma columacea]